VDRAVAWQLQGVALATPYFSWDYIFVTYSAFQTEI